MRSERAALGSAVWLTVVLAGLALGWFWYAGQLAPDYRIDMVVRLTTDLAPKPSVPVTLENGTREAWPLGVHAGPLRFYATIAGEEPSLRFREGFLQGLPSLGIELVREDGTRETLAELECSENSWTEQHVAVPARPGEQVEFLFRALDGRGRPGLGEVLLADVALLSTGCPVDETASTIPVESIVADLLTGMVVDFVRAPATEASRRVNMPGPKCLALVPNIPLHLSVRDVPHRATLRLVIHTGLLSDEGRMDPTWVTVRTDVVELARVRVDSSAISQLDKTPSRELLVSLDLGLYQGGKLDLVFEVVGGGNLFVGLREAYVTAKRSRMLQGFDPQASRNVLMLVVDGLRPDRLGLSGYSRGHTPNMDALASRGLVYSKVYAPSSWSLPNVASLLTGLSPLGHGIGLRPGRVLSPKVTTMAQSAAWAGSMTACFRNATQISRSTGLDRGYQRNVWRRLPATSLAEEALDWLAEAGQFQWFLTMHVNDPLPPHLAEFVDMSRLPADLDINLVARLAMLDSRPGAAEAQALELGQKVDSEIARVDRALGMLLDHLREKGLLERTLIVVVGASGQEFYEHSGLRDGQTLFDEVVIVPLIIAGPGISAPAVIDQPVPLVDAAHLIGDLGRMLTAGSISGGLPPPFGPDQPERTIHGLLRPYEGVTRQDLESSRRNDWLLVRQRDGTARALYSLDTDPMAGSDRLVDESDLRAIGEGEALTLAFEAWYEDELMSSAAWPVPWSP